MNERDHNNVPADQPTRRTSPPGPAEPFPGDPRQVCSDCGGNGWIMLFVKRRACDKCGGKGRVDAPPVTPVARVEDGTPKERDEVQSERPRDATTNVTVERGPLTRAPDVHMYHYGDPTPCPECGGRGRVALFTTDKPCGACEGSGQIWPEPRHEVIAGVVGYLRTDRGFDELGRVIWESTWIEPGEERRNAEC